MESFLGLLDVVWSHLVWFNWSFRAVHTSLFLLTLFFWLKWSRSIWRPEIILLKLKRTKWDLSYKFIIKAIVQVIAVSLKLFVFFNSFSLCGELIEFLWRIYYKIFFIFCWLWVTIKNCVLFFKFSKIWHFDSLSVSVFANYVYLHYLCFILLEVLFHTLGQILRVLQSFLDFTFLLSVLWSIVQ